jgi:hypothetical protein
VTSGELRGAELPLAHPPALPGTPSIDASYRSLIVSLPPGLRALGRSLPFKLGLTTSPEGGWGEFIGLHPNRELPVYAAESNVPGGAKLSLDAGELQRFVRAHHLGACAWLVRDRLADGQVAADDQLVELSRWLGERWRDAIVEATGDAALCDRLIGEAVARWRAGTAAEHRVLAAGKVNPTRYAALVRDKLGWIAVPSQALLLGRGGAARGEVFRQAHDLFLLSLQAVDDVIDRDEDRALRGSDFPSALGCSAGALLRAAPKLASRGAAAAARGGFSWFASWLEAFARAVDGWRLEGDVVVDELEAIGLAGEIEETIVDGAWKGGLGGELREDPPASPDAWPPA